MYGIYGDIIEAADRELECFYETEELLEYPEVQADKAYYLSVLSKYNKLKTLMHKRTSLEGVLKQQPEVEALLSEATTDEERDAIYEELSDLKRLAFELSSELSHALGCNGLEERVYCRFKFKENSSKIGVALFTLIKNDLLSHGAKIEDEKTGVAKNGFVQEISCTFEGADVYTRLIPLSGAHKVYIEGEKSEELCVAVTPSEAVPKVDERDLKIDLFHSHGAGGQNINKVETAVRVTHIPTGVVVVCQDERSQLKNKRRALETIEKRLKDASAQAEKNRIEADVRAQHSKRNYLISFDLKASTMSDTRLKAFSDVSFPMTDEQFTSYINGLIAL